MQKQNRRDIRPSPIAGSWYPGNAEELRRVLVGYLDNAKPPIVSEKIRGLILPHAGLIYSGLTAAYALKAIAGQRYDRVIIISPSHQAYRGHILTSAHEAYSTPLGEVPVDHASLRSLQDGLESSGLELNYIRNDREHSIEIELPFLQYLLTDGFQLIPLMLMDQGNATVKTFSEILVGLISGYPQGETTLLIASSDLSHFYEQDQANTLDQRTIKTLKKFDPNVSYLLKSLNQVEACGFGAIAAVLLTAKALGASQVTVADYRTSGDVSKDYASVVGYVSAIISEDKHE